MSRPSLRRGSPASVLGAALLSVFAVLALGSAAAPAALAYADYVHGGISPVACEVCHTDNHTNWPVASEKCLTCHTGYDAPDLPVTCWTCHTPGQDMSGARDDAACTAACHLPGGETVRHTAHDGGGPACTTCHPVSPTISDAGGDPHHVVPVPAAPVVAGFSPAGGAPGTAVTVTGTGFTKVTRVTFGGTRASTFTVISDTRLATLVPPGAETGPVTVQNAGGTGTSAESFVVPGRVTATVTLAVSPASVRRGSRVALTGAAGPASLGTAAVAVTVQRRDGARWTAVTTHSVLTAAGGSYAWAWRPPRAGAYRARAGLAATAGHTAARSAWAGFTVR